MMGAWYRLPSCLDAFVLRLWLGAFLCRPEKFDPPESPKVLMMGNDGRMVSASQSPRRFRSSTMAGRFSMPTREVRATRITKKP